MANGVIAWRELAGQLRDRITSGELHPGDRLPSEERLKQEYQLSRTTVRRAVAELRYVGLIVVRPPFGAFVAAPADTVQLDVGEWVTAETELTLTGLDGSTTAYPAGTRFGPRFRLIAPHRQS